MPDVDLHEILVGLAESFEEGASVLERGRSRVSIEEMECTIRFDAAIDTEGLSTKSKKRLTKRGLKLFDVRPYPVKPVRPAESKELQYTPPSVEVRVVFSILDVE